MQKKKNLKHAIIVIDMLQDSFKEERLKKHKKKLVESINELIEIGRRKNIPIIWVREEFKEDLSDAFLSMKKSGKKIAIENTPGCELLPELKNEKNDYEIIKKRYSAFFKTKLDSLLNDLNVNTLILAGVNTHACIHSAAVDAYQRDYEVILAIDCIDSYDAKFHEVFLEYLTKTISIALNNQDLKQKI